VLKHEAFRSGNFDTNFVETYFTPSALEQNGDENERLLAALLGVLLRENNKSTDLQNGQSHISLWKKNRV
jgi:hypothetical protein